MLTTLGDENGPICVELNVSLTDWLLLPAVLLWLSEPEWPPGSWGMSRFNIPLKRGARFIEGEYAGSIGGTLVTRFVRMPISMLHCRIVSLTLNGAISYARLCRHFLLVSHTGVLMEQDTFDGIGYTHIAESLECPASCAVHRKTRCTDMCSYSM